MLLTKKIVDERGKMGKKAEKWATLLIKVVPKSGKEGVIGWEEEELKIKIKEPPEKGKANEALISLLAKILRVPKQSITITKGESSRHKRVLILGLEQNEVDHFFPREVDLF